MYMYGGGVHLVRPLDGEEFNNEETNYFTATLKRPTKEGSVVSAARPS